MSKFFMYGTELHELEQLMMLVPNFMPRRSGVIVVKGIENKKEPVEHQDYDYPVCDCSSRSTGNCNPDKQVLAVSAYRKMIENYFIEGVSLRMNGRLELSKKH